MQCAFGFRDFFMQCTLGIGVYGLGFIRVRLVLG